MIERNPITGDPLIVAPDRARRPDNFREGGEACPFCPGNESMTPPEIARNGEPWRVRVFPNKFPATAHHEVVVESPRHADTFDTVPHADEAVQVYVDRYRALARDAAHVTLFKNHGAKAGATIPHLHSQIIATEFNPPRIERESAAFRDRCALCALQEPVIRETASYLWIAPRGSMFAYEQWIVPKSHEPEIHDPRELHELLRASSRAMLTIAPSYNWIFMNYPREPRAHWYVQLFPRTAIFAGFETGSGSAINVVDAITASKRLAAAAAIPPSGR